MEEDGNVAKERLLDVVFLKDEKDEEEEEEEEDETERK